MLFSTILLREGNRLNRLSLSSVFYAKLNVTNYVKRKASFIGLCRCFACQCSHCQIDGQLDTDKTQLQPHFYVKNRVKLTLLCFKFVLSADSLHTFKFFFSRVTRNIFALACLQVSCFHVKLNSLCYCKAFN